MPQAVRASTRRNRGGPKVGSKFAMPTARYSATCGIYNFIIARKHLVIGIAVGRCMTNRAKGWVLAFALSVVAWTAIAWGLVVIWTGTSS